MHTAATVHFSPPSHLSSSSHLLWQQILAFLFEVQIGALEHQFRNFQAVLIDSVESPPWLASQAGRGEEAEETMLWLYGLAPRRRRTPWGARQQPPDITLELEVLAQAAKIASAPDTDSGSGRDSSCALKSSCILDGWEMGLLEPMGRACTLMALQQFSGINAVNMFAGSILATAGVASADFAAIALAATHIVGTVLCVVINDSVGRRPLLAGCGRLAIDCSSISKGGSRPWLYIMIRLRGYFPSYALRIVDLG